MKSDTLLDYAVFQLSPKRSRCELIVSSDGNIEKLTSGSVTPFLTHLKVAEEQAALAVQSIKLEIDRHRNADLWFTKGTVERFVQFVGTPEILEIVNTLDAEMSQLEAARRIYSQGVGDQRRDSHGGSGTGAITAADATTKELLRAIDVRLGAVRQDLTTACGRASATGFNPNTVSQLKHFADQFGAHRLNEACTKYMSLYERRSDLMPRGDDRELLRSSVSSDMSIDNDDDQQARLGPNQIQTQAHEQQPKPSTWQQPKPFPTIRRSSSNNNVNQNDQVTDDNSKDDSPADPFQSTPHAPPARRLSVQDRINLFENKQKESSSGGGGGSTGGTKPVVGKSVELRRLSSDVSSATTAEKAVLRRWSGASDMSIDVSGEKKDNTGETPICTPSSASSVSQPKFNVTTVLEDKDHKNNSNSNSEAVINNNGKEQSGSRAPSTGRAEVVVKTDQGSSQETSKGSVFGEERSGRFKDQVGSEAPAARGSEAPAARGSEVVGRKNPVVSQLTSETVLAVRDVSSEVKFTGRKGGDGGMKNHVGPGSRFHGPSQSLSAQSEGGVAVGVGMKFKETSVVVPVEGNSYESTPQPHLRSFTRDVEDSSFSSKQPKDEDSQLPRMKYQRPQPREQIGKSHSKRNEVRGASEPDREVLESQDNTTRVTSVEQHQRVRQSKGNQGLHDELKMKADELEKLFAEHKLRVPVDQSGSVRRMEPVDAHGEQAVNSQHRRPVGAVESTPPLSSRNTVLDSAASSSNVATYDAKSLMKTVDNSPFGDDSRGKFYEKYMKKRNAKLREEWSSNRAEKEARMKAMQDSLERSRAEMKAKFSGSINRQDSGAHCADKVRYLKTNMKRDQHPIDSLQNEEDEDLSEYSEEKIYGTSRHIRKNLPNRNISSGTPRTTTASATRSSAGRRRDNPLAQSVPNFSDLRKENTKPYSGASKTTRAPVRNYARSKSTNEEMQGVKEEKPKQTPSLRKSSANPAEFKDLSPLNSDGVVLSPLRFDMDQTDAGPYDDDDQSSMSFLPKGNSIGPPGSAGSAMRRMKASMANDSQKNEEFDDLDFEEEDSVHMATEEHDEIETAIKHCAYNNNGGKVSLSQGSEKSGNSGSEIGDSTRSLSQVDPIPSTFNGVGSLQDSPVESPVSWNSRMRHPFSYPHESSDIDASLDSPIGSPASSWNSHSLTQVDNNDAARMRKKWGHAQPRKDVTKGFKRLLKFGRKSRGSESLVDWISATTSEGDDDTEDGRDPANRSSDDLRKSRMGFSHGHPSDDSFNESELFNEQVLSMRSSIPAPPAHFKLRDDHISGSSLKAPKSFFSLSTFRSKGGDSKPR